MTPKSVTQCQRVYRMLKGAHQMRNARQLAAFLGMPDASFRRCISQLRAAGYDVDVDRPTQIYFLRPTAPSVADAAAEAMRGLAADILR